MPVARPHTPNNVAKGGDLARKKRSSLESEARIASDWMRESLAIARSYSDMANAGKPTISVVVAAYQAERFIAEALESILSQTHPPEEVIVVDDGSTDGTARELERFTGRIHVVRRANGGCPAAFNTAFAEARGDFVALCGADDVWEPQKLEWQLQTIVEQPEVDLLCGHAVLFGRSEGEYSRPPGVGVLDGAALKDALYRQCCICAPSVLIRRSLFERLGPFIENFGADDHEYWFRCLRAGAIFYYDPRPLLSWRQHENNLTGRTEWMDECGDRVRRMYEADVSDRAIADDLFRIGRRLVDAGRPREARRAFRQSLRRGRHSASPANLRALAWVVILGLPGGVREGAGRSVTHVSRVLDALRGGRDPVLP
jgi:glycosyltransferase involved in cell wall biosynthesis